MSLVYTLIAVNFMCLIVLSIEFKLVERERAKAEDKLNDVYAGWMSSTTAKMAEFDKWTPILEVYANRIGEIERRLYCVEEDLEKIPVEEIVAESERLERFNDGLDAIMGYGFDIPKLNKEGLKHE